MKKITSGMYDVLIGMDHYHTLGEYLNNSQYSKIFILTDSNCNEYCVPHFLAHLPTEIPFEVIEIEAGEEFKTLETCLSIWEVLTELEADRNSVILNVGGGVLCDLGGFVASVFKRGIDHIHIPTTLLSMVDASIGGKTGIDLNGIKNQIGTFSLPKMVLVDVSYLETLEARELRSGYAEMLKHALIKDESYWNQLKNTAAIDFGDLEDLVYHSISIKNEVVTADPQERGERKILNFGHTIGHAIESYYLTVEGKERVLHGEAIAIGMIIESHLALQKGMLEAEKFTEITNVILEIYPYLECSNEEVVQIKKWLKHDKKTVHQKLRFALIEGIGEARYDVEVGEDLVDQAFDRYQDLSFN